MSHNSQGIVDPLDFSAVFERDTEQGPKATFTVPTDVTGARAEQSVITLKNLLRTAHAQLANVGLSTGEIAEMLAPVSALVEDGSYWRLQSRGLVIFAARDFFLAVRVPIEVRESLSVAEHFNLLPLAPVLASDRKCYVLALSKNSVRLFDSSRNTIEQLPLDNVPANFDEVIDELPERTVDVRAGASGDAPYAQGSGGDIDRMLLEKYIHAVGKALGERLGTARSQPLVLAAVAEYLPIFAQACPYPAVFDGVIAGNPEHTLPDDLRSAAWRVIGESESAREAAEEDRARSQAHNGKGAFDLVEIAKAAEEGRVDTLYLARSEQHLTAADSREFANRALIGTVRASGALRTLGALEGEALATFRY